MNRQSIHRLAIAALLFTAVVSKADHGQAQQRALKDQLVGAWSLVANENVASDGTKRQPFGSSPKGILILEANGRYAQVFTRPDRPKFNANNRLQGTPEEIKAAWDGALAHFGTWSVVEADRTVILHVEGSFYPNQEGSNDRRLVSSVTADELKFVNAASTAGGRTEAIFRRAK
jgi:lipocalin-like protein